MVETEEQEKFNRIAKTSIRRFQFFAKLAMTDILEECRLCVKTSFGDDELNIEWL